MLVALMSIVVVHRILVVPVPARAELPRPVRLMMVRLMSDRIVGDGSRLVARLATSGDACSLGG